MAGSICDLVELNGLQTRIGNRQCLAGDGITHLELVFGVRAFPHANEKFSDLVRSRVIASYVLCQFPQSTKAVLAVVHVVKPSIRLATEC